MANNIMRNDRTDLHNKKKTIFLGAGASNCFGIPTMREILIDFENHLEKTGNGDEKVLYKSLVEKLRGIYSDLDLESIITLLDDLSDKEKLNSRFAHPSVKYLLEENQLTDTMLESIDSETKNNAICLSLREKLINFIKDKCSPQRIDNQYEIYYKFFQALYPMERYSQSNYQYDCAIFTTNYDLCIENFCRLKEIPFESGETISSMKKNVVELSGRNTDLFSDKNVFKIFKLHGSINWFKISGKDIRDTIEWSSVPLNKGDMTLDYSQVDKELMIYPLYEKQIYKDPFSNMFFYLKNRLKVTYYWFIIGYSFRDKEIGEIFDDAIYYRLKKNLSTAVYIIDPLAKDIINDKFKNFIESEKIEFIPINEKFDKELSNKLDEIIKSIEY